MKKKILSFLLVFCLVLPSMFFMTACGKDNMPSTENSPAETPSTGGGETTGGGGTTPEPEAEFVYEISEDGKFVYFGEYPQTVKANDVTITSETPDDDGYYPGSDGERYYKYTVNIVYGAVGYYDDEEEAKALKQTTLSNGYEFSNGDTLYFKVEKIKWRILENEDGEYLLMCDSILKVMAYQLNYQYYNGNPYVTDQDGQFLYEEDGETMIYPNNYKHSALRKFLTTDFYNVAFTEGQKAIIKLTEVDNSKESTFTPLSDYACENTNDYVFALSYADMVNPEYGFSENKNEKDPSRCVTATDFAKATGAGTLTEEKIMKRYNVTKESEEWTMYAPYIGASDHLLRSPEAFTCYSITYIAEDGFSIAFAETPYKGVCRCFANSLAVR